MIRRWLQYLSSVCSRDERYLANKYDIEVRHNSLFHTIRSFWSRNADTQVVPASKHCKWRICNEEARGFNIIPATPDDETAILECMRKSVYWDDPIINSIRFRKKMSTTLEKLPLENLKEGMSFMAIKRKRGEVQGVAVAGTLRHNEALSSWSNEEILAAVGCRGRSLIDFRDHCAESADLLNMYLVSHALDVRCLGTVPEERKRGIANALLERVINHARDRGYPLVCMQCSTLEGKRVAEKAGMTEAWSMRIRDYIDERKKPIFKCVHPRARVYVMAANLHSYYNIR